MMDDWAGKNWDRRRMADGWPRAPSVPRAHVPRGPVTCVGRKLRRILYRVLQ